METIKNLCLGIFHGFWDSISGMTLVLHIDSEIHRLNAEKEAERRQRLLARERYMRRSPSPVPDSAAAMAREEREKSSSQLTHKNADERSLESIRKKPKSPEEQKPQCEKKVAKQVLKCCLLNGGFTWASILLFEQLLLPVLKFILTLCYGEQSTELHMVWGWLHSILSILFGMMWVLPIFLLSKIVSSLWFTDIANAAYRVRKGRPNMIPSISKLVADFLFSLLVQALFLVQSMLVNMLPVRYVGQGLCFLHLCLLYSLYAFEYKWFNMGWELHRRLSYIENNWPYFLGFGIPLTVLTNMSNSVIVSCIFSIFFPLFILSGNEAKPLVGTTDTPLRLFSPVIFASNLFFNRSGGRAQKNTVTIKSQHQQQSQQLQQQKMLEQQVRTQHRHQHQHREHSEEHHTPPHRYQQPPAQVNPQLQTRRSLSRSSPLRNTPERIVRERYMGMPPLIPTLVPGAPQPPAVAPIIPSGTPTVRHR